MSTYSFLIRRVLQALAVVLLVTVVVFCLLHALPGGPARGILGPQATAPQIAAFNHEQGLDKPLPVQYAYFLNQLVHGDLGMSYTLNEPVSQLITERLPKTLLLTVLSAVVGLLVAVPLGVWQAVRRNKPVDYVITTLSFIAYSTPVYFLGLVLVLVFSQVLPWFPAQAPQGNSVADVLAQPQGLVLPVVAGAATMVAVFSRYMRSATLENLTEDYVRTAHGRRLHVPGPS
ncbi:ABC transporter permease [Streptomyces violaceorubidus]